MNEEEIARWRQLGGYNGVYSINQFGNVRNNTTGKILAPAKTSTGYLCVSLCKNGKQKTHLVHRMVAKCFVEKNDDSYNVVNHLDGDKLNNYYKNLEWCSQKMNLYHAKVVLRRTIGLEKKRVKCLNTGEIFESISMASTIKKINYGNIVSVLSGRRLTAGGLFWEYIDSNNTYKDPRKCREPVMCIETGVIYENISQAFNETHIYNINSAALGRRETAGGYHWEKIDKKYFSDRHQ